MNITKTIETIEKALRHAKRPAVLWSGGKDATVLLDIAQKIRPGIEVIHFRLPFMSHKYAFHHMLMETDGLTVHDWPPIQVALVHGNNRIDVCETYSLGTGQLKVMRGTEPFEKDRPWVCGKEWLHRPKAHVFNDFDVLLHGHKSVDEDPINGHISLSVDMKLIGTGTQLWFPLRGWSEADIVEYTNDNKLFRDTNRYDDNLVTLSDKHGNTDYAHACFNCIDKRQGKFVHCPKFGIDVENIHEHVLHEQPVAEYCGIGTRLPEVRSVLQLQAQLAGVKEGQK